MSINQFALQTAIYTKLSTDNNLTSTLGASVFDDIPDLISAFAMENFRLTKSDRLNF